MVVSLSESQRIVVESKEPALAVAGLPGTGRTTTLAWRFYVESQGIGPARILVLVRNAAAANAFVATLRRMLGHDADSNDLNVFTFRAFAHREVVRCYDRLGWDETPIVLDADIDWDAKRRMLLDQRELSQWPRYGGQLSQPWLRKEVFDRALRISESGLDAEDLELRSMLVPSRLGWAEVDAFIDKFHDLMRQRGVLAQSDLLMAFRQLLTYHDVVDEWRSAYAVLLVDDAEDNVALQNDFIERVTESFTIGRTVIAGDPYGTMRLASGADPTWFQGLLRRVPKIDLTRNFVVPIGIGNVVQTLLPDTAPPQEWTDGSGGLRFLPVAPTYEVLLDQVVDIAATEGPSSSKEEPLAIVVPDLSDTIAVGRLRAISAARGLNVAVLYGSRRVIDNEFAHAAFTVCQICWPESFGAAAITNVCAALWTLFASSPELLVDLYSLSDHDTAGVDEIVQWCLSCGDRADWASAFAAGCTALRSENGSLQYLTRLACDFVLSAIERRQDLTLRDRRSATAAVEAFADAAARYSEQMVRTGLVDSAASGFADALTDPGFAPLSQEDQGISDKIVLATPMKLLELGWTLRTIVLLDLSDSTWVANQRRPLADAALLSRSWTGIRPSRPEDDESAVMQVTCVLRKLLLQVRDNVYITISAASPNGAPTKGRRLYTALRRSLAEASAT